MSEDAQFEAFLKGEDELSRRLQAMPLPEPRPELDAVIMKRVRFAHAQRSREAANDPKVVEPRLAAGSGARWRLPVGIAASVLVGVFATQIYQGDRASRDLAAERSADSIVIAGLPQESMPPPPPPAEAQMELREPPAKRVARPAAEPQLVAQAPRRDMPGLPMATPPPPPEPVIAAAPAVAADVAAELAVAQFAKPAPPAAAPSALSRSFEKVEVTGSRIRTADVSAPAPWLQQIEAMLEAGNSAAALAEWENFRKAHPDFPVPDATQAKIKAISR